MSKATFAYTRWTEAMIDRGLDLDVDAFDQRPLPDETDCEARTKSGHRCTRRATIALLAVALCEQHANVKTAHQVNQTKSQPKGAMRTPNPSFMKPVQPDALLAAVVGEKPLPRTELTSKLWDYIRKNGLQDQQERRMINTDDKLKPVFGGKGRVSMFDMTELINQHLLDD